MTSLHSRRQSLPFRRIARSLIPRAVYIVAALAPAAELNAQSVDQRADIRSPLGWESLPPIPDRVGLGSPFAGVSNGALVVAGGANFPEAPPWEGGIKVWHDAVYVLDKPDGAWKRGGTLPRPLAGGVSITTTDGIACLGGGDAERCYADCFLLQWQNDKLTISTLPSLPQPCANSAGVLFDNTIYVAGGIDRPDAAAALQTFWALDLNNRSPGWQVLKPWPGSGRMLATLGAQSGSVYLFSGTDLKPGDGDDGKPERIWLKDAYCYKPGGGWRRIADLPRVAVAAPAPAPALGQSHLLVFGGDDGSQAALPLESRTGFPRDVLAYHTITNTWITLGELPFSLVTTPAVTWRDQIVVPGGEARPGVRSTDVWAATIVSQHRSFGWLNYAAVVAYLGGMLAIGFYCAKRNRNTEDYFVASGRIPWWATGLSIYATMLSSITFMAVPAKSFATDWTFMWANVPLLLLAPIIIRYYLPFFRQLECASAYEYLEKRFNLPTRLYASAAFIVFQLGRQAYVLLLPSLALAAVTDLNVQTCIIIMGLLCVAYTVMGGMEAVIWTDVVQSIVLWGGALLGLIYIVSLSGYGLGGAIAVAAEHGKFHSIDWTLDASSTANALWVILLSNTFVNLISYTSDQAVVQRYMTTENEQQAARAIWTNALLALPSCALFFAIGTALFVYYHAHPALLDPTQPNDAVFPAFIVRNLPAGIAGIVIAGIFAAAQSTVSGSLNSVATAAMTDFYQRFGGRAEGRTGLLLARTLTAVIGVSATVVALVLASLNLASLWDGYLAMISLLCSGLAGLFALGIFTRTANGAGALVGAVTSAVLLFLAHRYTTIHFFMYATIGVTTCFVVGWLASQVLPSRRESLAGLTIYDRQPADGL